jgi:hypothetical protein
MTFPIRLLPEAKSEFDAATDKPSNGPIGTEAIMDREIVAV